MAKPITKKEAVGILRDRHTFWKVETAKEVCEVLGVKFDTRLINHYKGQADANPDNHPKGLFLREDKPCDGVFALALSDYVTKEIVGKLGLR